MNRQDMAANLQTDNRFNGSKKMICWFCYWGWPLAVYEIYKRALDALHGDARPLLYGPGHVVWADENFGHAQSCLDIFDQCRWLDDYSNEVWAIVRRSLEELAALPDEAWDVEPEDYDGEHPENYPPAAGVVMVKR